MHDRREQHQYFQSLAMAGGLTVATLIFAIVYNAVGWLIQDKPMAFALALGASFLSLKVSRSLFLCKLAGKDEEL